ncbi:tetratricopeptide repeat protein [Mucilaginibacter ginsenosidivorans]|uniref:Tetratricopeptide repeat protein n=1 Tax=Mucilaginibacter ginsenosidivorans TaxID=398053 RepID=A0A5B8UPV2_9SPHI|nr:tetratricopeptide repeat protein [Mucilaginibacter ginsenosidivorans]QEC61097.1 tetratricopeptide repeat protein [Mucilaginibacter ginsenosidivorans]
MKKLRIIFSILLMLPFVVLAQKDSTNKANRVVMVVGKPLTPGDSVMVKQLFFSALRDKTIENTTLAAEMFNQVLQVDPANDAAMYELASLKKDQNDYESAQDLLEKAVTVKPENEWYWVALADCYEKNNDATKLENVFNELLKINPDKPDYYFDQANVYYIEKKYDQALAVYEKLEKMIGPSDEIIAKKENIYLKQGKVDKAAADIQGLIDANPSEIRYYLLLGEIYNSNGFQDKALKVLKDAEQADPGSGRVHLALADIYRDKKDNEASYNQLMLAFKLPDLEIEQEVKIVLGYVPKFPDPNAKASALELSRLLTVAHPDDARSYALYGDMLIQNEKYPEAKTNYKKSLALNDQVYEVQEQLVRLDLGSNQLDEAIKDGENALSLFPNQAWLNYLVGVAYEQKKDFKKALSYVKNATSLESQDNDLLAQSYSVLGDCYHSMGDEQKSDDSYNKALSYNPDNAYTLNNYAYYLSVRGASLDKAEAMSKRSNELQPNTASFEDTYAWILFKQKKFTEAKIWIEKAISHDKDHSAVQTEHYGDIMYQLGDKDSALENWKKAKQYGGGSPVLERKINEKKYIE